MKDRALSLSLASIVAAAAIFVSLNSVSHAQEPVQRSRHMMIATDPGPVGAIAADGERVYVLRGSTAYGLDKATGTIMWKRDFPNYVRVPAK